jgi:hypothetical protein
MHVVRIPGIVEMQDAAASLAAELLPVPKSLHLEHLRVLAAVRDARTTLCESGGRLSHSTQ